MDRLCVSVYNVNLTFNITKLQRHIIYFRPIEEVTTDVGQAECGGKESTVALKKKKKRKKKKIRHLKVTPL